MAVVEASVRESEVFPNFCSNSFQNRSSSDGLILARLDRSLMIRLLVPRPTNPQAHRLPTPSQSPRRNMTDLPQISQIMDAMLMPLLGGCSLMLAKVSRGESARWAERSFLAVLVLITGITLRTVIRCDEIWLLHTTTLGIIIVSALTIPGQDHVAA